MKKNKEYFACSSVWEGEMTFDFLFFIGLLCLYPVMVVCIALTTNDKDDPRRN